MMRTRSSPSLPPASAGCSADAGARFAISPGATDTLFNAAKASAVPLIPGIATASELMRGIEQKALALRGDIDERAFMEIDDPAPAVALPMDRLLYTPPFKPKITHQALDTDTTPIPADALFGQVYVDQLELLSNIRRALQNSRQVSLGAVTATYPVKQGLAELATYLKLATHNMQSAIDDERTETIEWTDDAGHRRKATLPLIIYTL